MAPDGRQPDPPEHLPMSDEYEPRQIQERDGLYSHHTRSIVMDSSGFLDFNAVLH